LTARCRLQKYLPVGGQQFTWLFSSAFLRNHRRCGRPAPCWRAIRTRFEIVTGDGSSHVLPLERPDDFNHLVMNFLAG